MKIILISGPVSSGKSILSNELASVFGAHLVKTRDVIQKLTSSPADRLAMQAAGDLLDKKTRGRWVLDALAREVVNVSNANLNNSVFIVDSVRIAKQIRYIRSAYRPVTHLHVTAPREIREKWYNKKYKGKEVPSYDTVCENATEKNIESLAAVADVVIDASRCTKEDVLVRAASRMSLYGKNSASYVDVVIGGQFGSEGKGQIVDFIAKEYDLLVRVGGPNAGHKVFEEPEPYTYHHLPSGTRKSDAKLLLGPGMVVNPKLLLKEISECNVECGRLLIDPKVMVITPADIRKEEQLRKTIGSTGQGVGAATARRIMGRSSPVLKLAKHVKELRPYIRPAIDVLSDAFSSNQRVLLEGTQGTGLSLYHGYYPHVTSRDTTVSGCLSEAGISPSRVRKVIMVCRTYPIRVQNPKESSSGPMSQETSWAEISRRSEIKLSELRRTERTSTTNRRRRVGEFDWNLLRKASFLNGPTDIALTFSDYISVKNKEAKRFEQLTSETINMIDEIEHVSRAKVSLIATGFNSRSVIDRREW